MNLGLIGCGNMGFALLSGVMKSGLVMPGETWVYDVDDHKVQEISNQLGAQPTLSIEDMAPKCNMIIVAVKPQNIPELLEKNARFLDSKNTILISIAAGTRISQFRTHLKQTRIVRVMPNTPSLISQGASALYFEGDYSDLEKKAIVKIFESCGMAEIVAREELLDAVTGLSGSGPAYVFAFINSLADGGVREGLPRDVARKLAIQTVLGASQLAQGSLEEGIHLEDLKDRVTSPGGTTAAGLFALEKGSFRATVISAVHDATMRSKELGETK